VLWIPSIAGGIRRGEKKRGGGKGGEGTSSREKKEKVLGILARELSDWLTVPPGWREKKREEGKGTVPKGEKREGDAAPA